MLWLAALGGAKLPFGRVIWGRCCSVVLGQRRWSKSRAMQWKRVGEKEKRRRIKLKLCMVRALVGQFVMRQEVGGAVVLRRGAREGLRGGAAQGSSVGGWERLTSRGGAKHGFKAMEVLLMVKNTS